jgi:flagellar basal-body rod protein FlgC
MQINRFFSVFKTASQGMALQRKQIEVAAENIANANTTRVDGTNQPYAPRRVVTRGVENGSFNDMLTQTELSLRTTNPEHISGDTLAGGSQNDQSMAPESSVVSEQKYRYEYDPDNPDADKNGMVKYPDIDLVKEMTNMVSANRLYQANLSVVQAEKAVIKQSFSI